MVASCGLRKWMGWACAGLVAVVHTGVAGAQAAEAVAATAAVVTPAEALERLKAGNERFAAGQSQPRDYPAEVQATAGGQKPFAVILGCIDSRVPPEAVFDQGLGALFAPRIAGNFENTDILGSMEFATAVTGSPLIVVLGHTQCGAVKGAIDKVELGNLTEALANIRPAAEAVEAESGPGTSKDKDRVQAVAIRNVEQTVADISKRSPVIAQRIKEGKLAVVGAMYDIATGKVEFLPEHSEGGAH